MNKGKPTAEFVRLLTLGLVIWMLCISPAKAAVWTVVYPQSELENDHRSDYPLELLELALKKTGVRYRLIPSNSKMHKARAIKLLQDSIEINVLWAMTDNIREQNLRPIRVPINRGLSGHRVLLSHKDAEFSRSKIDSLNSLLAFRPVQGISWPDTKTLQANGFNVVTGVDYIDSLRIINEKLADFFPRSVIEAFDELKLSTSSELVLKKDLIVSYPTAVYFFTNKQNITLSRLIETGLQRALEDGSFETLFKKHYGQVLEMVVSKDAIVIELDNPQLPPATPVDNPMYWHFPNYIND